MTLSKQRTKSIHSGLVGHQTTVGTLVALDVGLARGRPGRRVQTLNKHFIQYNRGPNRCCMDYLLNAWGESRRPIKCLYQLEQ
jgi:hypothetical protein